MKILHHLLKQPSVSGNESQIAQFLLIPFNNERIAGKFARKFILEKISTIVFY